MPDSIRNAIILALLAVLIAVTGVGLLAWTRRPASPPAGSPRSHPLLVTERDGSIYDLNLKLRQMEQRFGEGQVTSQKLMEQLQKSNEERARLTARLTGLEKEVRNLRKRLQEAEQRLPSKQESDITTPEQTPVPPAATPESTTEGATTSIP